MQSLGTIETGAVLSVAVVVAIAVSGFAYRRLRSDIEGVGERIDGLEQQHAETRRLAESAYATVNGDEDRPEDDGFIVESKERWEQLEADIERLSDSVERLEVAQERHQQKTEIILDAIADEMDVEFHFRGGDGSVGD